jgi:hypothetical protein
VALCRESDELVRLGLGLFGLFICGAIYLLHLAGLF